MQKEFCTLLNRVLKEKKESGDADGIRISEVKIADIVFAYNNSKLIELLRKRGGYINAQKYDEMRAVEAEITKLKDDEYEKLTRPVCAFITFEEETATFWLRFERKLTGEAKSSPLLRNSSTKTSSSKRLPSL